MPSDRSSPPWDLPEPPGRNLGRILALEVELTAVIAEQKISLGSLLEVQPGSVLDFDKPVEALLDLRIHERSIAAGAAVLSGDRFGLRITQIRDLEARIRSLGPPGG
ncbi:MAG: FliM/FliN family flagellar motor switch protein [Planctomycetes bacterium]|nr:FliM/FliN family flagellar motor switch protein [Planctomycetota bacterium]